ncbi:hypothetical protein KC330_g4177 [Hortaea werneckii]|nr:hypothetical protein KC330_g4177 [Hortaea werneckii]
MLTRNLKRALLDSQWSLPPTFLLPWAASLSTVSHTTEGSHVPPPLTNSGNHASTERRALHPSRKPPPVPYRPSASSDEPKLPSPSASPPALSDSVRELLPVLQAQGPHYISAHLYDRPYLLTQGDTVRLPFLMKGVEPGDVLRLNKASLLGSRDYTLKAAAAPPKMKSNTMTTITVNDPTTGNLGSESKVMPDPNSPIETPAGPSANRVAAPHFIPHLAKGKYSYIDERLYVCRAVVMGVESEPMRVKEKTKRRQRKVKHVKSKHRYTILRVKEVRVKSLEEIEEIEAGNEEELD